MGNEESGNFTGEKKPCQQTKSEIYVSAIQILFGIIIAISFIDYHKTLVPPFNYNFETLLIFVTYATVLMSLIGFSIAVKNRFHKKIWRFGIDVFLLYLYFQLVYSLQFSFDYFLWIFPMIFGSYVVWQVLEYYEWKSTDNEKPYTHKEFKWVFGGTFFFTIVFLLVALSYNGIVEEKNGYFLHDLDMGLINGTAIVEERTDGVLHYLNVGDIEWKILGFLVALVFGFRIFFYYVQKYKT